MALGTNVCPTNLISFLDVITSKMNNRQKSRSLLSGLIKGPRLCEPQAIDMKVKAFGVDARVKNWMAQNLRVDFQGEPRVVSEIWLLCTRVPQGSVLGLLPY